MITRQKEKRQHHSGEDVHPTPLEGSIDPLRSNILLSVSSLPSEPLVAEETEIHSSSSSSCSSHPQVPPGEHNSPIQTVLNNSFAAAKRLIAGKITSHTKDSYISCINRLKTWLREHQYSQCTRDGDFSQCLVLPLPPRALLEYFGWMADLKTDPIQLTVLPNESKESTISFGEPESITNAAASDARPAKRGAKRKRVAGRSASSLNTTRSALIWYYCNSNEFIDPRLRKEISDIIKGHRKEIASKRKKGELPAIEGIPSQFQASVC